MTNSIPVVTDTPIVIELRAAVTRLRCEHSFPVQPPHGSLFAPGPCDGCEMPWDAQIDLADRLREPLASWLETEAVLCEKRGNSTEGHTFEALRVARQINGTTSEES